jgi:sensor histidine kinase regulating citrate/malate metabolism
MSKKRSVKPTAVVRKTPASPWLKTAAAALDSVQANIFVADPAFKIVFINESAKGTLG